MRTAARFEKTLALALLAHGGALLAMGRLAQRPGPGLASSPSGDSIEIRIETTPIASQDAPEPPVQPPTQTVEDAPPRASARARVARSTRDAPPSGPEGVATLSLPRGPSAPEASGRPWTFSPSAAASVWLGLRSSPDGRSTFEEDAVRRPASDAVSTTGAVDSLRAALEAHDRSLGLGAGGPLVEPTREAVSSSLVPDFARAILEFTTDRAGIVVSVRVLDATGGRQAWDEVAQKLALDTRKKPLRMPSGARGVAVTMQVESMIRNASGQDPGQGILSRAAGGLFEPSELLMDSQARPRRVVVARVLSETRL